MNYTMTDSKIEVQVPKTLEETFKRHFKTTRFDPNKDVWVINRTTLSTRKLDRFIKQFLPSQLAAGLSKKFEITEKHANGTQTRHVIQRLDHDETLPNLDQKNSFLIDSVNIVKNEITMIEAEVEELKSVLNEKLEDLKSAHAAMTTLEKLRGNIYTRRMSLYRKQQQI